MSETIFRLESAKACLCKALGILCPPLMTQTAIDTAMQDAVDKRDKLTKDLQEAKTFSEDSEIRQDIQKLDREIAELQKQQERLHTENSQTRIDALQQQIDSAHGSIPDIAIAEMQDELDIRRQLHELGIVNPEMQEGVLELADSDHKTDRNTADRILNEDVRAFTFGEAQASHTDALAENPDFDPATQIAVYVDPDNPEKGVRIIDKGTWGLAPRNGNAILINTERINDNDDIQSTLVHEVNHVLNDGENEKFIPEGATDGQESAIRSFTTEMRANIAEQEFDDEIADVISSPEEAETAILNEMEINPSDPYLTSGQKLVLSQVDNFINSGVDVSSPEGRQQLERIFIADKLANPTKLDSSSYKSLRDAIKDGNPVVHQAIQEIMAEGPGGNLDNDI